MQPKRDILLSNPVSELLGARVSPELTKTIRQEVLSFPQVRGVYDLILHNYGPSVMIGSLHVSLDDTVKADEIHALSRDIQALMFQKHGIVMTVGVYSVATGNNRRAQLQQQVMQLASAHKEIVQVHGFFYSERDKILSIDIVPDFDVHDFGPLIATLTAEIQPLVPDYQVAIVVDYNYSD